MKFELAAVGLGMSDSRIGNLSGLFQYIYREEAEGKADIEGSSDIRTGLRNSLKDCLERLNLTDKRINLYALQAEKDDLSHLKAMTMDGDLFQSNRSDSWTVQAVDQDLKSVLSLSKTILKKNSADIVILLEIQRSPGHFNISTLALGQAGTANAENTLASLASPVELESLAGTAEFPELLSIAGTATDLLNSLVNIKPPTSISGCSINFPLEREVKNSLFQLIKVILCLATRTMPAGKIIENDVLSAESKYYTASFSRPWVTQKELGKSKPRIGGLLQVFDEVSYIIPVKENERLDRLPVEVEQETEVIVFKASSKEELQNYIEGLSSFMVNSPSLRLKDVAYSLYNHSKEVSGDSVLTMVASSLEDLQTKLELSRELIANNTGTKNGSIPLSGIYYTDKENRIEGDVTFLLPGLGSAYANMLADMWLIHPVIRIAFDYLDYLAGKVDTQTLPSRLIFPTDSSSIDRAKSGAALVKAEFAVAAVLLIEFALDHTLKEMELKPDSYLGLSTGEYGSYFMNGYTRIETIAERFYKFAVEVARSIPRSSSDALTTLNVFDSKETVEALFEEDSSQIHLVADLSPQHVVITGPTRAMDSLLQKLKEKGITGLKAPAAIPYHTPLVEGLLPTEEAIFFSDSYDFGKIEIPSWSAALATKAPEEKDSIDELAVNLFHRPIRFRETIEKAYQSGSRIFLEVGPGSLLTSKVNETLSDKPRIAAFTNSPSKSSTTQLNHLLALLISQGKSLKLDHLFKRRNCTSLNLFEYENKEIITNYLNNVSYMNEITNQAIKVVLDKYASRQGDDITHLNSEDGREAVLTWVSATQFDLSPQSCQSCLEKHFSEEEKQNYNTEFRNSDRKLQWFMGRLAAKKAVQELILKAQGKRITAKDISIFSGRKKKPRALVNSGEEELVIPVSISHTEELACALATSSEHPGIDIEKVRLLEDDIKDLVCTEIETRKVQKTGNTSHLFLKLWTAKEAAFKSLGGTSIKDYELEDISGDGSVITMRGQTGRVKIYSGMKGDHIYSFTIPAG